MSDEYYDIDGNKVSLDKLCRTEPAWAANVIRTQQSQIRTLVEALEKIVLGKNFASTHEGVQYIADDVLMKIKGKDYFRKLKEVTE